MAALAMIRDSYEGAQMAPQMSLIMAVFILVPTFAPALAVGILAVGAWQAIYWTCAAFAALVSVAVIRLLETSPAQMQEGPDRSSLSVGAAWRNCRAVLVTPGMVGYLVSLIALFGIFLSYLASSEIVLDQVVGLSEWFPVFFGGIAVAMGSSMSITGRFVERVGLRRITGWVFWANMAMAVVLLLVALSTGGRPPFGLFVVLLGAVLFAQQMLIPNLKAMAMRPLAHVAGTGAAILGMVAGVCGAVIGGFIDRQFDGTVTPLAIGFVISSLAASGAWRWAVSRDPLASD